MPYNFIRTYICWKSCLFHVSLTFKISFYIFYAKSFLLKVPVSCLLNNILPYFTIELYLFEVPVGCCPIGISLTFLFIVICVGGSGTLLSNWFLPHISFTNISFLDFRRLRSNGLFITYIVIVCRCFNKLLSHILIVYSIHVYICWMFPMFLVCFFK